MNQENGFSENALKHHFTTAERFSKDVAKLLYAAGELINSDTVFRRRRGGVSLPMRMNNFLRKPHVTFSLASITRCAVRRHLLEASSVNLCWRVRWLGTTHSAAGVLAV